jgi:membrane protein required for beta-lactamase induction
VISGQKVVVAWLTSVGSIVATTFSSTPRVSESDATTETVVDGAGSDPVLVTAPGHGVSLAFATCIAATGPIR